MAYQYRILQNKKNTTFLGTTQKVGFHRAGTLKGPPAERPLKRLAQDNWISMRSPLAVEKSVRGRPGASRGRPGASRGRLGSVPAASRERPGSDPAGGAHPTVAMGIPQKSQKNADSENYHKKMKTANLAMIFTA